MFSSGKIIFLDTGWCGQSTDGRKMRASDLVGTVQLLIHDALFLLVFVSFAVISPWRIPLSIGSSRQGFSRQRHHRILGSTGTVLQTNE